MGSTKFEGGLLQKVYKVNKLNYPKPMLTISYKRILSVTNDYTIYKLDTKIHKLDTKMHKCK
jgi:hypothetical protein